MWHVASQLFTVQSLLSLNGFFVHGFPINGVWLNLDRHLPLKKYPLLPGIVIQTKGKNILDIHPGVLKKPIQPYIEVSSKGNWGVT